MAAMDLQKRWGLIMGLRGLLMLLAGLYAVIWPGAVPSIQSGAQNVSSVALCRRASTRVRMPASPIAIAIVGQSPAVALYWRTPLAFLFIDGGHGVEPARADYEGWTPHVALGGTLAIHDVFADPADGGRAPYEQIFLPAMDSGRFTLQSATGSLHILRRVA